jgi:hypothetical protein
MQNFMVFMVLLLANWADESSIFAFVLKADKYKFFTFM